MWLHCWHAEEQTPDEHAIQTCVFLAIMGTDWMQVMQEGKSTISFYDDWTARRVTQGCEIPCVGASGIEAFTDHLVFVVETKEKRRGYPVQFLKATGSQSWPLLLHSANIPLSRMSNGTSFAITSPSQARLMKQRPLRGLRRNTTKKILYITLLHIINI